MVEGKRWTAASGARVSRRSADWPGMEEPYSVELLTTVMPAHVAASRQEMYGSCRQVA